jgi:hypothetical protein
VQVLKRVLSTVAGGRVGNTAELADALGVSPAMVEAMVAELELRGLLHRLGDCGEPCDGCPSEMQCGPAPKGSAWMLTTLGRRYASG